MSDQQRHFRLGFLLALLLGAAVLLFFCFPRNTFYYRSVRDVATNTTPWRDYLKINDEIFTASSKKPIYVVTNNLVYLQVRRTRSIPILLAAFKSENKVWTLSELRDLAANHPELRELWPAPEASNLGVEWISSSK